MKRLLWTAGLLLGGPQRLLKRLAYALRPGRRDPLELEFARRGPWVSRFAIGGRAYGGSVDLSDDARVRSFFDACPDCRSVLELGSLEGAHTFQLAERADRVLAIEGRERNVAKARFVQELLRVENVEFRQANLEELELASLGRFDGIFCAGLLYHLPRPWLLLDQLGGVAPCLLLSTHYAAEAEAEHEGVPGHWFRELGHRDPLSGLSPRSFWMTLPALLDRLEEQGYEPALVRDDRDHVNGPLVTLTARRAQ